MVCNENSHGKSSLIKLSWALAKENVTNRKVMVRHLKMVAKRQLERQTVEFKLSEKKCMDISWCVLNQQINFDICNLKGLCQIV